MTEPGRKSANAIVNIGTAGGFLGAITGVAIAMTGGMSLVHWFGNPPGACEAASRHAPVILGILAACGVVAWLTMRRPRRRTKLRAMAGWFAIWLAGAVAFPWQDSYSFVVIVGLGDCVPH